MKEMQWVRLEQVHRLAKHGITNSTCEVGIQGKDQIGHSRKTWEEQVCNAVKERRVRWNHARM